MVATPMNRFIHDFVREFSNSVALAKQALASPAVTGTPLTDHPIATAPGKSVENRLAELKHLFEAGLITKDAYEQKMKEILNGM